MAEVEKYRPGEFCWAELATTDVAAAKLFYGGVFGWRSHDIPMGPGEIYTMMQIGGKDVAAMYSMRDEQRKQGAPPNWMLYIASDNVDGTAKQIQEAGGTVIAGPFDVFTAGRMLIAMDTEGAMFGVWQAGEHIGARLRNQDGTFCWPELAARDEAKARDFYTRAFGYQVKTSPGGPMAYTEWQVEGQSIGGMMQIKQEWGAVPPNWMPYFQVADCDATVAKAASLGAEALHGPHDIENVGRFAVLQDPLGAVFSVIRLTMPM